MSKLMLEVRTPGFQRYRSLPALPDPNTPLSLVDRAALHLGLWLLLRGTRRADQSANREAHALRLANERSRIEREATTLRLQHLWPRL